MKKLLACSVAALVIAGPAFAKKLGSSSPPAYSNPATCSVNDLSLAAIACQGRFTGNALSNNSSDLTLQHDALNALGLDWDKTTFNSMPKVSPLSGSHFIGFKDASNKPITLAGITYIGVHVGGGAGGGTTSFYKFDAGAAGETKFHFIPESSSAAVLYLTGTPTQPPAVPEPASWAMMISGFGAIGMALRNRKRVVSFQ